MRFTRREIKDLLAAWILISLAFAILFSGIQTFYQQPGLFVLGFLIAALTAGIGFLLHELMHKYVAQQYGLAAEFVAFYKMLFFAIIIAFFGFIIAAPGAVFIRGRISPEKNGKISLAGPATNIVLAVLFLIPAFLFTTTGALNLFIRYGLLINALLGLFNMIPFMPFDGGKVFAWNKGVWTITIVLAAILLVVGYTV